jgi:hypothetical protein
VFSRLTSTTRPSCHSVAHEPLTYRLGYGLAGELNRILSGKDGVWVPVEHLGDEHALTVDSDASPGEYLTEVGVCDAGTTDFRRLPLLDTDASVVDNRIILDTVLEVEVP